MSLSKILLFHQEVFGKWFALESSASLEAANNYGFDGDYLQYLGEGDGLYVMEGGCLATSRPIHGPPKLAKCT